MGSTLKSVILRLLPITLVVILAILLFSLINLSSKPEQTRFPDGLLLPLTIATSLVLTLMVIGYGIVIVRRLRAKETGSRYALRLMTAFAVFTIFPVMIVTYFSLNFIGDRIDEWFQTDIERALGDSLELSGRALRTATLLHLQDLGGAAKQLSALEIEDYQDYVTKVRPELKAFEIVVLSTNKRVIAYSTDNIDKVIPRFPGNEIYQALTHRGVFFRVEPDGEGSLYSRVAITMQGLDLTEKFIVTALFPISQKYTQLSESVRSTRDRYSRLKFNSDDLKSAFRLTLFIVMTLSILFALWAAFLYSQRLTSPVKTLVDGTLAVASGDLQKKLPVSDKDDFSLLARSFNTMTARLSKAMRESEQSREQVLRQNDYLNVVLNHLTSGVMTLDEDMKIRRINNVGVNLLEINMVNSIDKLLPDLFNESKIMPYFIDGVTSSLNKNKNEWKTEITVIEGNKRRVLMCQGAVLTQLVDGSRGHVIVFDEISDLIEAEHEAAWGEVAIRLAHEIKNPLTPIQLSAERLQHRLTPELSEKSADLLLRMTNTIVSQVESMKSMVNAFSDYAKSPGLDLRPYDVNALLREVSDLYNRNEQDVSIDLTLNPIPSLLVDHNRMRQVFINLVKNALEALENSEQKGTLSIHTEVKDSDPDNHHVSIQFIDNGSGFKPDLLPKVFEPYVSSKTKGSGLGLAIVKKIIEEHSGRISAKNNDEKGAIIEIKLPINVEPELP